MRIRKSNTTAVYIIALAVIIVAFFLLGGGTWMRGITHHGGRSTFMPNLQWVQILLSLGIGFLLGYLAAKRKW